MRTAKIGPDLRLRSRRVSRGRLVASLAIQEHSVQQMFFELSCIFAVLVIFVAVFRLFLLRKTCSPTLPKQLSYRNLAPRASRLPSLFLAIAITIDVILQDISNVFQIMLNVNWLWRIIRAIWAIYLASRLRLHFRGMRWRAKSNFRSPARRVEPIKNGWRFWMNNKPH